MNKKVEEGLPDIAQATVRNKKMLVSVMILVLVVVGVMYCHTRGTKKVTKPIEDVYSMQSDASVDDKKIQPVVNELVQKPAETPVSTEVIQQQVALMQDKQKELQQRLSAPLMLVNTSQTSNGASAASPPSQLVSRDANTQFMNQVASQSDEVSNASMIGPLNCVIAEGSLIHATLESAINSDLPGFLRAIVSEPVYSEDGSQILIPPGSRLIGQYKSGMLQGQSRIFVVWTRIITPPGISIDLGSPGVDSLGMAGTEADEINRHFWQRFSTASLLSLLGAGVSSIGVNSQDQNNSTAAYREAVPSSLEQSANQSLQQEGSIAPTLKQYQGKQINVFVSKDLHFESIMKVAKPHIRLF